MIATLVKDFMLLFQGYRGAYGTYIIQDANSLKKKGRGVTKKGAVTPALWQAHLEGTIESGIGIIPIDEDSQCYWGAIDIDVYEDFDVVEFAKEVKDLPLVICRSKSGGAHCFMFVKDPIPALQMQTQLRKIAAALGYAGAEIFPKQITRRDSGDIGNWLNMPYFNYKKPTRYCINGEGKALNAEEFIAYAKTKQLQAVQEVKVNITKDANFDELFATGAPCHEAMYRRGIQATVDGRNNCLYSIGQQFKRQRPDDWKELLLSFNKAHCKPPLGDAEVLQIANSIEKGDGFYKCKDACCSSNCDKELCLTRKYGVGDDMCLMPAFTGIQKLGGRRDCVWYLTLDSNETVQLSTEELFSPAKVRCRLVEALDHPIVLPEISAKDWRVKIQKLMDNACEIIEDASTIEDVIYAAIEDFCSQQRMGASIMDVLDGKPFKDAKGVWFRIVDLLKYITTMSGRYNRVVTTPQQLSTYLRTRGNGAEEKPFCKYYKNKRLTSAPDGPRANLWLFPSSYSPKVNAEVEVEEPEIDEERIDLFEHMRCEDIYES